MQFKPITPSKRAIAFSSSQSNSILTASPIVRSGFTGSLIYSQSLDAIA
ncbi:hypothetical protein [Nostoc sp. DedQUE09]|nr:hypothetical protein [Nostoc sp. DedQUE09]MDZ7954783.1 hypothetical protein [Nostoc sp. DedQUE09]